jgi:hypothetical protein
MDKQSILSNISYPAVTAEIIAEAIMSGSLSLQECVNTGEFELPKKKQVNELLKIYELEENDYKNATSLSLLKDFLNTYPNSRHNDDVRDKISHLIQIEEQKKLIEIEKIKNNINEYKPDEVKKKLSEEECRILCDELGISYDVFNEYEEPPLLFGDIPLESEDIPVGFTDVFFWGIPSSGKTCALSAILRTMKDKYTITSPTNLEKNFGAVYRDSLINIYKNQTAFLPAATQKDRTQYMPFLLKKRDHDKKNDEYRKISFFELSGEVFEYIYELNNQKNILSINQRESVETAFESLNLLLESDNQKIHFFFIDYQSETRSKRDKNNLTQENYLDAAATYFRNRGDLFVKKTDAVYVILTKSDLIKADESNNSDATQIASEFLNGNFGNFMDVIKDQCKKSSVNFEVKMFSIGEVFFKSISKLDYRFTSNIIEDLLRKVRPVSENKLKNYLIGLFKS